LDSAEKFEKNKNKKILQKKYTLLTCVTRERACVTSLYFLGGMRKGAFFRVRVKIIEEKHGVKIIRRPPDGRLPDSVFFQYSRKNFHLQLAENLSKQLVRIGAPFPQLSGKNKSYA
jgi:hypothetical protein